MKKILGVLIFLVLLGYPFLVYFGLSHFEPRFLGALLIGLVLLRLGSLWNSRHSAHFLRLVLPVLALLGIGILVIGFNQGKFLLFYPVLFNAALLFVFGASLWSSPTLIEIFARMQVKELTKEEIGYCRKVTWGWSLFFLLNGSTALVLALWGELSSWTFYNGFLAYVLMGTFFLLELTYRYWQYRPYHGAPTDLLFRKIFPPRDES